MKSMKKFAAQQLTKKQMNEVKGGDYLCSCSSNAKNFIFKGGMEYADLHQMWASVSCSDGRTTCYRLS